MVDRARFTLAKTSYRSRCWLNTYWKDEFWPHEFRTVECLKRYVDIWKRFICYIFRVLHFGTRQRQDIYHLKFGHDEIFMMRHILYLVALLQREAESFDGNSDEAREEEGDESSDGDDEECFEEYNGVETRSHLGEDDVYYDVNDDGDIVSADPAFVLPSGLWLHLSEAIFQLSMMFWI